MTPTERRSYINKLADLIEKHTPEIAALESLDNGKAYQMACIDAGFGVEILRYYAGYTDKILGDVLPIGGKYFAYTRHEPVGVCG